MPPASSTHRRTAKAKKVTFEPKVEEHTRSGTRTAPLLTRFLTGIALISAIFLAVYYYYSYLLWEPPSTAKLEEDLLSPFQVVDLPGKGKGVIATRDIAQGELLLREKPLFLVPTHITSSPGALLLTSLARLTPVQRKSFYDLSYVNFPRDVIPDTPEYNEALALAIFQTNSIAAGSNVGIFPRMARFNHGCSSAFNSVYTWREKEGFLVAHALKAIKKGEELLTTYTDTKRPRDSRRRYLHTHYGFTCQCAVCSLPDDLSRKSDSRLSRMSELYSQFARWGDSSISGQEAANIAREIWSIGEEERYWSERGRLAADAAWVAAAHSDDVAAREWAALALEWYAYELGADSEQAHEMQNVIADAEKHPVWGSRHEEHVGGPKKV
ncbi:unnamed protein product [Somion occarium]|uniref:SET domain-containing protein n=1 Tax=Somion occarium TaxID=3059160 RepID=A0ABP1E1V3_9APHY